MSVGKNKAIFRAMKLTRGRAKSSIGSSWRHQQYHDKVADISHKELSGQNKTKLYIEDYATLRNTIKGYIKQHNEIVAKERTSMLAEGKTKKLPRNLRKDAAVACECVFTFSPEMASKIDIDEWVKANAKFIREEFTSKGAIPVRLDLHMDETTPHLHFIFLPITKEGKISAKEYLGSAGKLSKMQDRYAEAVSEFGLTRGFSRYNAYKILQQQAVKHGFGADYESVKKYCASIGVPVPEQNKHLSKQRWLAKLQESINKAESELKDLEHQKEIAEKMAGRAAGEKALLTCEIDRLKQAKEDEIAQYLTLKAETEKLQAESEKIKQEIAKEQKELKEWIFDDRSSQPEAENGSWYSQLGDDALR